MARPSTRTVLIIGMVASLALAGGISYFASGHPDGLEWAAGEVGVEEHDQVWTGAPMPDYTTPGVDEESHLSTAISGVVGVLIMFAVGCGLGLLLRRPRKDDSTDQSGGPLDGPALASSGGSA